MRKKTKPKETNFDSSNHHHQHQHQHQLMPSLTYDCDVKLKEHQSSWIPIDSHECKIGIYGWRKKFLYILIVIITATVIINGALTLWIIMMLNISFVWLIISYHDLFNNIKIILIFFNLEQNWEHSSDFRWNCTRWQCIHQWKIVCIFNIIKTSFVQINKNIITIFYFQFFNRMKT